MNPVTLAPSGALDPHRRLRQKAAEVATTTGPIASPCVSICQMDAASGWCKGCLRTLDEIMVWSQCPDAEKRNIWQKLALRKMPHRV